MLYRSCWTFSRGVSTASKLQHTSLVCDKGGKVCTPQGRLLSMITRLKKWPWPITSVRPHCWWQTQNHHTVECFRISSIKGVCVTFYQLLRPPDTYFFWLLVYLFLLKVEVCMSETCSCTKKNKHFCNLLVCGRRWFSCCCCFLVGPHVLSHSTEEEEEAGPSK